MFTPSSMVSKPSNGSPQGGSDFSKSKSSKRNLLAAILVLLVLVLGAGLVYLYWQGAQNNGGLNQSKYQEPELGNVSADEAANNLPQSFPLFGQTRIFYSGATSTTSSISVTQFLSNSTVGENFYGYKRYLEESGWTINSLDDMVSRNSYGYLESSKGGEKITLAVIIPPLTVGKYIPGNSNSGLMVFKGYSFVTITYSR